MNQSYFDQVYRKTYPNLMQYAITHLYDPTDAEDALQNVYSVESELIASVQIPIPVTE